MLIRSLVVLLVALSLIACSKKRSAATVVAKEHIAIAEAKPSPSPQPTPVETITTAEEMKPDEIEVDGYVMKKDIRGTSKDPRAAKDEQWRITVEIEDIGLRKLIQSDRAHYDKLKVGDRIRVAYYKGKYTGTVWAADIED
jgi:hypothetical protein